MRRTRDLKREEDALSLTVLGIPCRRERFLPAARSASRFFAMARTLSTGATPLSQTSRMEGTPPRLTFLVPDAAE
jgi:hypothetical protein